MRGIFGAGIIVGVLAYTAAATAQGNGTQTGATGPQAGRGATIFGNSCSVCHGADMRGGDGAPALIGPEFAFSWKGKTAADLFDYIKTNMPPGQQGSLSDQQYADLLMVILRENGIAVGPAELSADPAKLKALLISAG